MPRVGQTLLNLLSKFWSAFGSHTGQHSKPECSDREDISSSIPPGSTADPSIPLNEDRCPQALSVKFDIKFNSADTCTLLQGSVQSSKPQDSFQVLLLLLSNLAERSRPREIVTTNKWTIFFGAIMATMAVVNAIANEETLRCLSFSVFFWSSLLS